MPIQPDPQPYPSEPVQANGWISPNGDFYPTYFAGGHEIIANKLGTDEWTLGKRGWLHITMGDIVYYTGTPITAAQDDTIRKIIEIDPWSKLGMNLGGFLNNPNLWIEFPHRND